MFEQRQSAAARVNLIFSGFVTKNTPFLQDIVYPEDAFIKKKKNTAQVDFLWTEIAHIFMQKLPEQKTLKVVLFFCFFSRPAVS